MLNILLVDDSRFMRSYLKKILNEANFNEIIEADNGLQAIDMYKIHSPDIVIMDITMPLLNGIDALKEIIKIDPHAKVVMCTALGGQQSIIKETLIIGAKDFVVKPYFHNLVSIVNTLLGDLEDSW
ncbi:response regulator [Psychrobacillus sp. PGGUH221]|uniref:response regulator n=1 Tax=Psychrobacillus sp. PGGUH221 TaxID=3020058 RepID=UPI0035C732D8